MIVNCSIENIKITALTTEFMKKGVYQSEMSDSKNKYYKVPRETWMSTDDSYVIKNGRMTYGNSGDILLTTHSYAEDSAFLNDVISIFFGGHCSSVCYDEAYKGKRYSNNYSIESHYYDNVQYVYSGFWDDENKKRDVMALRVKASDEKKKEAFHNIADCIGKKYNKTFIFNTKDRYYCTDLISRAWEKVGIDLNYDGFYCSVQDIVCSDETYISFYKVCKKDVNYYYYLG